MSAATIAFDVLVIGSGAAGLSAALSLAPHLRVGVLAKGDISEAADQAYDRDLLDRRPYNGIKSHQLVKQGPVAVAGRTGYFVRWRVRTEAGPGGYVQSLAFPSSVGSEAPVIVRFVFDAGEQAPPLADMDTITKGIRPVGDADTGGGVGSGVGPT